MSDAARRAAASKRSAGKLKVSALAALVLGASGPAAAQQVRHLQGHDEPLYSVVYSPDGEQVVSGSFDRTVRIWNRSTGQVVRKIEDHQGTVLSLAISRDGKSLATGSLDRAARIYDMPYAKALAEIIGLPATCTAAALSPDGAWLAIGCGDRRVRLYATADRKHQRDLDGLQDDILDVAFTNDQRLVLALSKDGRVRAWYREDGRPAGDVKVPGGVVLGVHPDNRSFAVGGADGIGRFFQWPEQPRVKIDGATHDVLDVAPSPDGQWTAVASKDGKVRLHALGDGKYIREANFGSTPTAVAVSRDGQHFAAVGENGELKVWRSGDAGIAAELLAHTGKATDVAFLPDNRHVLTVGPEGVARLWALPILGWRDTKPHNAPLLALAGTGDNNHVVTGGGDKGVKVLRLGDLGEHKSLNGQEDQVVAVAVTADNGRVLTASRDQKLRIFNLGDGNKVTETAPHGAPLKAAAVHPNGQEMAGGGENGVVKLWKTGDGAFIREFPVPGNLVGLGYLDNGNQLVAAADRTVRIVKTADGATVRNFDLPAPITSFALSKDGQFLALGGADNQVRIVRTNDGGVVHTLAGHGGQVSATAFFADGKQVVSAAADRSVRVWSLDPAITVQAWTTPQPPRSVLAKADGKSIAVGLEDGTLQVFPTSVVRAFAVPGGPTSLAVHANGSAFYVGGADKVVRRFPLDKPQPDKQFDGFNGEIRGLALAPDGNHIAACGGDRTVRVWRTNDGGEAAQWQVAGQVRGVAFAPDNRRVAVACEDKVIRILDVPTKLLQEEIAFSDLAVHAVEFVPNSPRLVSGGADRSARVTSIAATKAFPLHQGKITSLAFTADGNQFFTCGEDRGALLWNSNDGKEARRFQIGSGQAFRSLVRSGNQQVFASGGDDRNLRVGNFNNGQQQAEIGTPAPIVAVRLDQEGRTVLVAGADGKLRNYAFLQQNGQFRLELVQEMTAHNGPVGGLALSADLKQAWTVGTDKGVKQWAPARAGLRQQFGHGNYVYGLDFSPDGTKLVTACADKTVRFWKLADGSNYATGNGHENIVYGVAWHPNGSQVVSCGGDRTLRFWDANGQKGKELREDIVDALYSVAYHPQNGDWVLSGGLAKTWQLWRNGHDKPERTVGGHPDYVYKAVFSPNGNRVATIGYGGHLRIWDTFSGELKHQQKLEVASAYSLAYAPGGDELAVATQDNRLWLVTVPGGAR